MPVGSKNTIIPGCGTHHIAVQTWDWEASLKLYQDVLGMTEVAIWVGSDGKRLMLLDIGDGSHIELIETVEASVGGAASPLMHVALATTDARHATEQVRQAGYEITIEPKDLNLGGLEVTIAFFKGPSGEVVEFFQTH